jgi:Tol biopolymer transport system component
MTVLALWSLVAAAPLLAFEREAGGKRDVCFVPVAGGPERCLAHPADDGWPRFYSDGQRVLFSSDRSGGWQLWEAAVDGRPASRLRGSAAREWQADVSTDGRRVAFLSDAPGRETLRLFEPATSREQELVRHGPRTTLGNPDFSPDGRSIVFSSNATLGHHVYLWSDGMREPKRLSPLFHGGCSPRFTPDGRKVVYVARRHLRKTSWIVEHDLATGRERTLVDWPALNYDPVVSPDGLELAFASTVTGEFQVYRLRLADGRSWRVTYGPGAARMPDYQPR